MPVVTLDKQQYFPTNVLPEQQTEQDGFFTNFGQSFGPALTEENTVFNLVDDFASGQLARNFEPIDESFDPFEHIPDGYEDQAHMFWDANSREEIFMKAAEIDRTRENMDEIARNGAGGMAALFAAGMLDPVFMIPVVGQVGKGGSVLNTGLATAKAGLMGSAASEVILQHTKEDRTLTESAWNVGVSTLAAGVFGMGIEGLSRGMGRSTDEVMKIIQRDMEIPQPAKGDAGAMMVPKTTLEQETLIGSMGVARAFKETTPYLRMVHSPFVTARRAIQDMNPTNLVFKKNFEGIANPESVWQNIRSWDVPLGDSIVAIDQGFTKYRLGKVKGRAAATKISMSDRISKMQGRATDKLTRQQFHDEVGAALHTGAHDIPEVLETARFIKDTYLDPVKKQLVELGVFGNDAEGLIENYFKRVWDNTKIKARRSEFKDRVILKYLKTQRDKMAREAAEQPAPKDGETIKRPTDFTDDELDSIADEIIDRISAQREGKLPYDLADDVAELKGAGGAKAVRSASLRQRTLRDIPFEDIRPYLILDAEQVLRLYNNSVIPDLELIRKFGDLDMGNLRKQIQEEADGLANKAKNEAEATKIQDLRDKTIRDLEAVRDIMRGTYGLPNDPTSVWVRAARVARANNLLRFMGDVVGSSIADVARVPMTQGFTNTLRHAIVPMIKNRTMYAKSAREAGRRAAVMEMVLNTRLQRMSDISDIYAGGTKLERGLRGMTDTFGLVSLIGPWNQFLKQVVARTAEARIIEESVALAAGKLSKKKAGYLAASGIDERTARIIAEQYGKHGEKIDGIMLLGDWDNTPAAQKALRTFSLALQKEADQAIVTSGPADRPLMMQTETGRTIMQFKTFTFAAAQAVTISGLQRRDAQVMMGALMSVGLGAMIYGYKTAAAGKTPSDDPRAWVKEGIDRSGILTWLMEGNNVLEKLSGNNVGLSAMLDAPISSRYASRNTLSAWAGPTFGMVGEVGTIASGALRGDMNDAEIHAVRRLMPYQNHFAFRPLYNQAQESAKEMYGSD